MLFTKLAIVIGCSYRDFEAMRKFLELCWEARQITKIEKEILLKKLNEREKIYGSRCGKALPKFQNQGVI